MDWTSVAVALITAAGALLGTYLANRKSAALLEYRLKQLEEKVDKHNHFAERMPVLEEKITVANHRIDDLEKKVG